MARYIPWEGHRPIKYDLDVKKVELWPYFCSDGRIEKVPLRRGAQFEIQEKREIAALQRIYVI